MSARRSLLASVVAASLLAACGGERLPPADLVKARADLRAAKSSVAMQLDPTDVHEAEVALQKAEGAWNDDPDAPSTIDLAVIAQLKAQEAVAQANAIKAQRDKEAAAKALTAEQAAKLAALQNDLSKTRGDLNKTQGDLNKTQEQLDREKQQTAEERKRREDAEKKLQDARDTLARIAQVKDEDRGMVITMQGEVLFKTNEATLKPAAMVKLDQVADALRGQERKILVLGHTDNVGGNTKFNQDLSEKRANAVRDYLVSKGIPSDLIRAEGRGPTQPVAENNTVEGRATNRRVEIVVEPKVAK